MSLSAVDPVTVHERVHLLLSAAGALPEPGRGPAVFGLVDAADPGAPIRAEVGGAGCGGGRRVVLEGAGVALLDGVRPTHLLVRARSPQGTAVDVLVDRGTRGVDPWPGDGTTEAGVDFTPARVEAGAVVSGDLR